LADWDLVAELDHYIPTRTAPKALPKRAPSFLPSGVAVRPAIALLYGTFAVQILSALFFVGDLWTEVLGLRTVPIPYDWQEYIQVLATVGLIAGVVVSGVFIRQSLSRMAVLNRQIDVTTGQYQSHLLRYFGRWQLSPSEQAVAIYAMKGFSNAEIADIRGTSASTIKSQMNAVFRKAEFQTRQQLIAFMVEEMLVGMEQQVGEDKAA
jgi:DNA-binding CsgD family transcriptional regulator